MYNFCLFFRQSTEETFVQDYQKWASRFMVFVGKTNLESQWKLLKRYLTDVAKVGSVAFKSSAQFMSL